MLAPCERASKAIASPILYISSSFQVLACASEVGKTVVPIAMCPCGHSSANKTGIPKRVSSTAYFCKAFSALADNSGFKPVSNVFCVQGSARRTAQNEPIGIAFIRSL